MQTCLLLQGWYADGPFEVQLGLWYCATRSLFGPGMCTTCIALCCGAVHKSRAGLAMTSDLACWLRCTGLSFFDSVLLHVAFQDAPMNSCGLSICSNDSLVVEEPQAKAVATAKSKAVAAATAAAEAALRPRLELSAGSAAVADGGVLALHCHLQHVKTHQQRQVGFTI